MTVTPAPATRPIEDVHRQADSRLGSLARTTASWLLVLALWELVGRTLLQGRHLIGVPSGIVLKLVDNAETYLRGLWFTTSEAFMGYVIGNLAAVVLALVVVLLPGLERLVLRLALIVYCLPLVALGPLLRLLFGFGDGPQVTLAALAVYYLSLVPLLVGLRALPRSWLELTASYGRGRWMTLITVRARAAVPYLMAGLQASVPAAFLGALVGEFTGAERGLGVLSILALRSLDTDGLWALMLLSTVVSLIGYQIVAWLAQRLTGEQPAVLLSPGAFDAQSPRWHRWLRGCAGVLLTGAVVLAAWAGLFELLGLDPYFAKRPWDVWEWLITSPAAADHRREIIAASGQTAAVAIPGYFAGLLAGVVMAAVFSLSIRIRQALTPVAVALRCVPIIAIAPLLVAALGRGPVGTAVVVAIMTFFPTLVSCLYGLGRLPGQVADVFATYATPAPRMLLLGRLPAMMPSFFASARIAAPTSLLAATVAEWLATGTGLGNMMAVDAATSRYASLWATVVVVTVIALVAYALIELVEQRVLAVVAPEQTRW
ncbi:ABC transporter permease subunit [Propionimicrobium sp. PCR01-08-3]|uniref:ABC transporter permease n=1 Tax=Propionimicrobium sp. PCR01-08-3 TaxID=3052086 RepID=UPI00255CA393|nr:ABC transporter permease subunit [Propionimicrobium sp. PCR01-08-3]WIY82931.1 ABC transporter permease subunit [Propionimicrobium sp. PCR01-08-3]